MTTRHDLRTSFGSDGVWLAGHLRAIEHGAKTRCRAGKIDDLRAATSYLVNHESVRAMRSGIGPEGEDAAMGGAEPFAYYGTDRSAGGSWINALDRLSIETAGQLAQARRPVDEAAPDRLK